MHEDNELEMSQTAAHENVIRFRDKFISSLLQNIDIEAIDDPDMNETNYNAIVKRKMLHNFLSQLKNHLKVSMEVT